eukprot:5136721-Prymnesium_polylepis.1
MLDPKCKHAHRQAERRLIMLLGRRAVGKHTPSQPRARRPAGCQLGWRSCAQRARQVDDFLPADAHGACAPVELGLKGQQQVGRHHRNGARLQRLAESVRMWPGAARREDIRRVEQQCLVRTRLGGRGLERVRDLLAAVAVARHVDEHAVGGVVQIFGRKPAVLVPRRAPRVNTAAEAEQQRALAVHIGRHALFRRSQPHPGQQQQRQIVPNAQVLRRQRARSDGGHTERLHDGGGVGMRPLIGAERLHVIGAPHQMVGAAAPCRPMPRVRWAREGAAAQHQQTRGGLGGHTADVARNGELVYPPRQLAWRECVGICPRLRLVGIGVNGERTAHRAAREVEAGWCPNRARTPAILCGEGRVLPPQRRCGIRA